MRVGERIIKYVRMKGVATKTNNMTSKVTGLTTKQKIMIGGLGGITPVFVNMLIVDFEIILQNLNAITMIGFTIRLVTLFYIGGIVAYLNQEDSPVKVFQLGIVAPAMITAAINGSNINVSKPPTAPVTTPVTVNGSSLSVPVFPVAEAYNTTISLISNSYAADEHKSKGWHVVVGSYTEKEKAMKRAEEVRAKGFTATVYDPDSDSQEYSVVIGAFQSFEEARKLRLRAIEAGFTKGVYLWISPKEFSFPEESLTQKFLRGFIGLQPRNVWFVIAGAYTKIEDAQIQAIKIQKLGLEAEVYQPNLFKSRYPVVIGSFLTHSEAETLRQQAIKKEVPGNVDLWPLYGE